ncbi:hypothetical protein B0H14DRAFT_2642669 [Mycena olivaceomarginata]|nr:hypothetical protein B0H14DRAFT_2642669 [Mycena olivaceomarginata]
MDHEKCQADAVEAQNARLKQEQARLKQEQKKSAQRERRLRKKNTDFKMRVQEAQEELKQATAHSEAQVRAVLKKRREDDLGWQRRLAEADDTEFRTAWSKEELKKKILDISHLRGVLQLARRQTNRRNKVSKRSVAVRTRWSCVRLHAFLFRMAARRGRSGT